MKRVFPVILIAVCALAGCARIKQFADPPAAKFYRDYRRGVVQEDVRNYMELINHNFVDYNLDVTSAEEENAVYYIQASETVRWMPPNAAGINFATIVTRELSAVVEEIDGEWQVTGETVESENISTYEQRQ